jgi:hypothetical protein
VGAQRTSLAGAGAGFIAFLVAAGYDWVWQIAVVPICALLLGAALLVAAPDRAPRPQRAMDRWVLGLVACVATVAIAVPLAEQAQLGISRADVTAGRLGDGLRAAATARRIEPFAAGPPLSEALILERFGALRGARAALAQSIERTPTDWRLWVIRARLDTELHEVAAARAALHRARVLDPRSPATAGTIANGRHGSVTTPTGLLGLGACVPSGVSDLVQSIETIPGAACAVADPVLRAPRADQHLEALASSSRDAPSPAGLAWPLGVLATLLRGGGPGGFGPALPVFFAVTLLAGAVTRLRVSRRRAAAIRRA